MTRVRISCPNTWAEQIEWIGQHCKDYYDATTWQGWCLGVHDIYYYLTETDATMFYLRWPS